MSRQSPHRTARPAPAAGPPGSGLTLAGLLAAALLLAGLGSARPSAARAADPPAAVGTREVVATGVGTDVDGARRDARRAALEQAVGTYVDSEQLVRNETVVRDQVLAVSDGFVESAADEGQPRQLPGGLWQVRARAVVRDEKLRGRIAELRLAAVPPEARSAIEGEVEKVRQAADARKLLPKYLTRLRAELLTARVVDERGEERAVPTAAAAGDGGNVSLAWTIEVGYDRRAYERAADTLTTLFNAVTDADTSGELTIRTADARVVGGKPVRSALFATGRGVRWANFKNAVSGQLPKVGRDHLLVLLNTSKGGDPNQQSFRWYKFDRAAGEPLLAPLAGPTSLEVAALDAAGRTLSRGTVPLDVTLLAADAGGRAAPPELKMYNQMFLGTRQVPGWTGYVRTNTGCPVVVITPEFVDAVGPQGNHQVTDQVVVRYTARLRQADAERVRRLRILSAGGAVDRGRP